MNIDYMPAITIEKRKIPTQSIDIKKEKPKIKINIDINIGSVRVNDYVSVSNILNRIKEIENEMLTVSNYIKESIYSGQDVDYINDKIQNLIDTDNADTRTTIPILCMFEIVNMYFLEGEKAINELGYLAKEISEKYKDLDNESVDIVNALFKSDIDELFSFSTRNSKYNSMLISVKNTHSAISIMAKLSNIDDSSYDVSKESYSMKIKNMVNSYVYVRENNLALIDKLRNMLFLIESLVVDNNY